MGFTIKKTRFHANPKRYEEMVKDKDGMVINWDELSNPRVAAAYKTNLDIFHTDADSELPVNMKILESNLQDGDGLVFDIVQAETMHEEIAWPMPNASSFKGPLYCQGVVAKEVVKAAIMAYASQLTQMGADPALMASTECFPDKPIDKPANNVDNHWHLLEHLYTRDIEHIGWIYLTTPRIGKLIAILKMVDLLARLPNLVELRVYNIKLKEIGVCEHDVSDISDISSASADERKAIEIKATTIGIGVLQ
ncbi:hypothetical protein GGI25_004763 [Coemansia spiralis]|uniref:Uncharacterized protein n=2 Tax=Coemansia TaxID=4863 RepID=A0A9W8G4Z3_9FUNG|nr:hypothetical protein GGI25_004763 [Coemansia spiralis]